MRKTRHQSCWPAASEFRDRVAVVTGGTDGLGLDLTRALCSLGTHVFFCGRRTARGRTLERRLGPRAHFIQCDLADPADTRRFVIAAGTFREKLDYFVSNAAIDPRIAFEKAAVEDFDRLMAVNLRPSFVAIQAALPYIRKGLGKAVVITITTNYMLGLTPFTLYNASKSGLLGFMRSLAREVGPLGIRVNAISPGWIMTAKQLRQHVRVTDKRQLIRDQCLKFLLVPERITPVTLFLLSSASAALTGQNIVVDGGKVMS